MTNIERARGRQTNDTPPLRGDHVDHVVVYHKTRTNCPLDLSNFKTDTTLLRNGHADLALFLFTKDIVKEVFICLWLKNMEKLSNGAKH